MIDDPTKPTAVPQDTAKARISRNVDKMAAQGASEREIEEYLQNEGMNPVAGSGNIDLRAPSESTRVTPMPAQPNEPGSEYGLLDRTLNALTLGAHSPIIATGDAIGDILHHGLNAHPIDTFGKSLDATAHREAAAGRAHPLLAPVADIAGLTGATLLAGPLSEAVGLTEAAPAGGEGLAKFRESTTLGNRVATEAAERATAGSPAGGPS